MSPNSAELAPPPKLSPEQLQELAEFIRDSLKSINEGRSDRIDKIKLYREFFKDNFTGRVKPGSIWELSNVGVPLIKGVAVSYASKVEDEALSGDPPFQVKPIGSEDIPLSEAGQRYWPWEIVDQIGWDERASESVWVMCSEGTSITKRLWKTRKSFYPRRERWLVDETTGQPVLIDGNPVTEGKYEIVEKIEATWLISTVRKKFIVLGRDGAGQEILGPEVTESMKFVDIDLMDSVTHYDNAEICCIPFEDFYCSLNVAKIEDSKLIGHGYVQSLEDMIDRMRESAGGELSEEALTDTGWIPEELYALKNAADINDQGQKDSKSSSKATQDIPAAFAAIMELGEKPEKLIGSLKNDELKKRLQFIECYIKKDIGAGVPVNLVAIYEPSTEKVVFCDYHVRVYADCESPFTAHAFFRAAGRWYGLSPYEFFAQAQEYIDKVFNRSNYRSSISANPGEWVKPDNFMHLPDERGPGWRAQLKKEAQIADSIGYIQMPTLEGMEEQHFQFFVSLMQLMTGISNAAQGDIASLPSTATATGISTIVEEGNKLYRLFIRRFLRSMKKELRGLIKLIQQNVKEERIFRYRKGDAEVLARMTPEEIRQMDFDVDIVMSKNGSRQKAESIQSGLQIVGQWLQTPDEMKPRLRPLFAQLLQILGIPNPDDILPTIEELEQDQTQDQILQQAAEKIGAAVAQIQGANLDPKKAAIDPLLQVIQMLQAVIVKGPVKQPQGQGAEMPENPMEATETENPMAPQAPTGAPV